MKVIGIIPARYASTRFPGKPLVLIDGKTMIQRVYEQARQAVSLSEVVVATDDQRIADEVNRFGGRVLMTSSFHQNGTERCAEAAQLLGEHADVVINIQGDEPFIHPETIDQLAQQFKQSETQIATLAIPCNDFEQIKRSSAVKVVLNQQHQAMYFSRSVIPFYRNNSGTYLRHIGIYGFRKSVLEAVVLLPESKLERAEMLEQLRWLENGYTIHVGITQHESQSIDTPEDLQRL